MELIDTHCHLDVEAFNLDRNEVINHCQQIGITKIFVPGIKFSTWDNLLKICGQQSILYSALGLHPMFIKHHKVQHLLQLQTYITEHSPCAIGEIGLDFYIKNSDTEKQLEFFSAQLDIAKQNNLPVILHVRKAHQQVLKILEQKAIKSGIVHAYSGSIEEAQRYIKLGFKLGFGGMLTYPRSSKLRQIATQLPLSTIVLETDAPDMSGQNHHGQRNSPEYLPECLAALSELRTESIEDIAVQTSANANNVFNSA